MSRYVKFDRLCCLGVMDNVAVWNRALSVDEINALNHYPG